VSAYARWSAGGRGEAAAEGTACANDYECETRNARDFQSWSGNRNLPFLDGARRRVLAAPLEYA
jgi:hypothetical protein